MSAQSNQQPPAHHPAPPRLDLRAIEADEAALQQAQEADMPNEALRDRCARAARCDHQHTDHIPPVRQTVSPRLLQSERYADGTPGALEYNRLHAEIHRPFVWVQS